ncbi:MAG: phosphate/phosphite/phosphonate ABC transporter substrate-binding protein [Opitutaceae bacterium]
MMGRFRLKCIGCLLGVLMCLLLTAANTQAVPEGQLRVAFDRSLFHGLNENDAVAALKVWVKHFTKTQGVDMEVEIVSYESRGEVDRLLAEEGADLFIMSAAGFLGTAPELRSTIIPQFTSALQDGSPFESYHLLSHVDSNLLQWEDLAGKDIILLDANRAHLTREWFLQGVAAHGLQHEGMDIQVVENISQAILPVFFKQADACIVNNSGYELMKEFNPQIGQKLKTVVTSPEFSETLICLRENYQSHRDEVIKGLRELDEDPTGRQVVLIFKIDQLIEFEAHYLDSAKELLNDIEGVSNPWSSALVESVDGD